MDSTCDEFRTTLSLSHMISVGCGIPSAPLSGIPNILNLYLRCTISSTHAFIAINSDPNVLASIVFCFLLYQITGARFTNIMYPECDLLVFLFAACDASTYAQVSTGLPLGKGILGDNSSLA